MTGPQDQSRPGPSDCADQPAGARRRRQRYSGRYPKRFGDKYKEHHPELYPETIEKVVRSGKTPAGSHRPIMVAEVLHALAPAPGDLGVDCTMGYGGHAQALLTKIRPGGKLLALDTDPIQFARTETRLRSMGFGINELLTSRTNFAGLRSALSAAGLDRVDFIFADLGVSSMQLDDPARGFTYKAEGPLDMRMNPQKVETASTLLERLTSAELRRLLSDNADEPHASRLAEGLAGRKIGTTTELAREVDRILSGLSQDEAEAAKRRTFQALRIAVNQELTTLEALLRSVPLGLKPGGRVAFLSFHSGEDRRIKQAFLEGLRRGVYKEISRDAMRPTPKEAGANPRARPAKLRWAVRSDKQEGTEP